jgi:hypothetical protein
MKAETMKAEMMKAEITESVPRPFRVFFLFQLSVFIFHRLPGVAA